MRKETCEEILQSSGADALFLTDPANMRFVTGFCGEGYVYVSRHRVVVVTDSRYTIAAKAECPDARIIEWKPKAYYVPLVEAVKADGVKKLGIEDEVMTVAGQTRLAGALRAENAGDIRLVPMHDAVQNLRWIKTEQEICRIEEAEAIGDRAFTKALSVLKAGMTEKQVAAYLEFFMKEEGADGLSFETIAASGVHSAMPHAVPTDKRIVSGDFLTMDFGCRYMGYCSDMTRTVFFGKPSDKQREIYDTVLLAQETALAGIRPGMTGREVDALARNVIKERGYGDCFGHSLGHSVGLEIHEKPCFSPGDESIIEPGMVITVEPGIYIENFCGVRIEDVVAVTKEGCRNLTHSPKALLEIRTETETETA